MRDTGGEIVDQAAGGEHLVRTRPRIDDDAVQLDGGHLTRARALARSVTPAVLRAPGGATSSRGQAPARRHGRRPMTTRDLAPAVHHRRRAERARAKRLNDAGLGAELEIAEVYLFG
jgi:hypothetical protein